MPSFNQGGSEKRLWPKCKRGALNQPAFNKVYAHQLDATRTFRKSARDILMVNHDAPENLSSNELGMDIGLDKT